MDTGSDSNLSTAVNNSTSTTSCLYSAPSTSRNTFANNKNECYTFVEPVHLRQEWTISNFSSVLKLAMPGLCLRSAMFKDPGVPDACWQLCLYPGGKRPENANNVSLFLKMSATSPVKELNLKAEYKFYFIKDDGVYGFSNVNIGDFHAKPPKGGHSWGLRNIPRSKVESCIRNDTSLLVVCEIELMPDQGRILCKEMTNNFSRDVVSVDKRYLCRFSDMYETRDLTDCTIICQNQVFNTHKFMLATQSSVFRAMFSHKNTKESLEECINIVDSTPSAVSKMIGYIYSADIPGELDIEEAASLVQLAEKYDMEQMKILCEEKLIIQLSKSNVCSLLQFADTYNAELLQQACIEMISTFRKTIMVSEDWFDMKKQYPSLINQVLELIIAFDNSPPSKKRK
uniref:BTB domain-containing protein n=1 Tax=Parastrongyloides trichosuri TaxID=131310 RepID=A0A0N4ZKS6_PARTI